MMKIIHLFRVNKYWSYIQQLPWRFLVPIQVKKAEAKLERGVIFHGAPIVTITGNASISIGEGAVLC